MYPETEVPEKITTRLFIPELMTPGLLILEIYTIGLLTSENLSLPEKNVSGNTWGALKLNYL